MLTSLPLLTFSISGPDLTVIGAMLRASFMYLRQ